MTVNSSQETINYMGNSCDCATIFFSSDDLPAHDEGAYGQGTMTQEDIRRTFGQPQRFQDNENDMFRHRESHQQSHQSYASPPPKVPNGTTSLNSSTLDIGFDPRTPRTPHSFGTNSELSSSDRRALLSPIILKNEDDMWEDVRRDLHALDVSLTQDTLDFQNIPTTTATTSRSSSGGGGSSSSSSSSNSNHNTTYANTNRNSDMHSRNSSMHSSAGTSSSKFGGQRLGSVDDSDGDVGDMNDVFLQIAPTKKFGRDVMTEAEEALKMMETTINDSDYDDYDGEDYDDADVDEQEEEGEEEEEKEVDRDQGMLKLSPPNDAPPPTGVAALRGLLE